MYFLYVLRCSDDTLYTGITTDLERRVKEHNHSLKGAKYTKARRPVSLVYSALYIDRGEATKAEIAFKKLKKEEKEKVIIKK